MHMFSFAHRTRLAIGSVAVASFLIGPAHAQTPSTLPSATQPSTQPTIDQNAAGYLTATQPRTWSFPRDHGRHDGFKTEWWYFVGNVADEAGRQFGYELTFFRASVSPIAMPRESVLSIGDYYFAHAAVSDLAGGPNHAGAFYFKDRLEHEGAGVASSAAETLNVSLGDWSAHLASPTTAPSTATQPVPSAISLDAADAEFGFHFSCAQPPADPLAAAVLQGPDGINRKGRERSQASYYYSIPRLPTTGTIVVKGQTFHVVGHTWMDHEFSSNALGANQVGWDWVGLTLKNGDGLMVYRLRNKAGGADYLSGTLIDPSGKPKYLTDRDITFTASSFAKDIWKSESGGIYPQVWALTVAGLPPMTIRSKMPGQELRTDSTTKIDYFEGACDVMSAAGTSVGEGYLEMTGYARPLTPF